MIDRIENYHQGILDWVISQAGENASSTAKGDYFCQWCLENIFELSNDEAVDAREISGSFDHSIDALIVSDEKLTVVQTKYENAHNWSEVTKFHYDMQRIREGKVRELETNDIAFRAIVDIQDAYQMQWEVKYFYITSDEFTETERSKIERLPGYSADFFFYDLPEIVYNLDRKQQDVPESIKGKWLPLRLSSRELLKFADTTAVIAVSLNEMHDFVAQAGDDLFASNVRQYLRGTKINTGIRNTIQKSPDRFWLYNNGITIVCEDFMEENFSIKIQTPQIVNGCQTAKSIWDILSKKVAEDRKQLHGYVLVRIIKGADEEEKENITRYTNTQNAVRGKDFFSLEQFQRKLQKRFKSLGYYYEIQRGSFASLKASERAKYRGISDLSYLVDNRFKNLIPSLEAVQAFTSGFKQFPAVAYGTPYELTPGGSWYDKIFDASLEPEPKVFLYPYLIREWAKNNGYSRGGGGWRAHSASFFVFTYFVIVIEILKHLGYVEFLELSPENIQMDIWDRIFNAGTINQELLFMTDDILERYFQDSTIHEAVGLDVRKFLKSQDSLNRHKVILMRLIENLISSPRNRNLIQQVEIVLGAYTQT